MTGTRTRFDMQVTGLSELVIGLRTMQGPELAKTIEDSASRTIRGVAVPAMKRQMSADFKHKGSHREPKRRGGGGEQATPRPGRGGPAESNVRVRRLRKRGNEIVAISAGPRAWYAHLPIGGTEPHSLEGRKGAGRYSVLPMQANAAAGRAARNRMGLRLSLAGQAAPGWGTWEQKTVGLRGIRISGRAGAASVRGSVRFNRGLRHPGTRGTNSIQKAVRGIEPVMNTRYASDLQKAYDRRIAGPTRRARPR